MSIVRFSQLFDHYIMFVCIETARAHPRRFIQLHGLDRIPQVSASKSSCRDLE
jgi:hypothetical protein